jgi:hypothetical protein
VFGFIRSLNNSQYKLSIMADFIDLQIHFNTDDGAPHPFIDRIFNYENNGTEGVLEFDGYYYVNDSEEAAAKARSEYEYVYAHTLPQEAQMIICKDCMLTHAYEIQIYKREKIENTDKFSIVDEPDGSEMSVCFFPTDRQRIYFKVLDTMVQPANYDSTK